MGRGLDGFFDARVGGLCSFEGPRRQARGRRRLIEAPGRPVSNNFRWLWRGGNTSSHSEQSS